MHTPPQGPQFQGDRTEYCLNCTRNYKRTPETEPKHLAPCQRCDSDGHAACQHRPMFHVKHRPKGS